MGRKERKRDAERGLMLSEKEREEIHRREDRVTKRKEGLGNKKWKKRRDRGKERGARKISKHMEVERRDQRKPKRKELENRGKE